MIAALVASIVANVALAYLFFRHLATVEAATARERAAVALERARIMQRIQAPEAAIQEHAIASAPVHAPAAVSAFDDADYWEAQGLSKEDLAGMAMSQELAHA